MSFSKILDIFSSIFNNKNITDVSKVAAAVLSETTTQTIDTAEIIKVNDFANIPAKSSDAATGSKFLHDNMKNDHSSREANILHEFQKGNVPDFLRNFQPVHVSLGANTITYFVSPDYLSIGTNNDYCRMPMNPITAQKIADLYGCVLPTKKMVDDIYRSAAIKLEAVPHGPPYNEEMEGTARFEWSNEQIKNQLIGKEPGTLVAGHKKDIIIDKSLLSRRGNVSIYGWFAHGKPIQGVNSVSHSINYSDYAHGVRLIYSKATVNGAEKNIYDILNDGSVSSLINSDGAFDARKIYR